MFTNTVLSQNFTAITWSKEIHSASEGVYREDLVVDEDNAKRGQLR